ncbi:hypothetical protein MTR_8g007590 [Medicago truncatula]|uniref:Uncharacterized protein n=1 Tax=Medicago truncatula TaxID=3880 RepID=A0A072TWP8_MEDTR|nr:hypothetical protein MTR_8g007590 [Medicago truncatula]
MEMQKRRSTNKLEECAFHEARRPDRIRILTRLFWLERELTKLELGCDLSINTFSLTRKRYGSSILDIKWHRSLNFRGPKSITSDKHVVRIWDPDTVGQNCSYSDHVKLIS